MQRRNSPFYVEYIISKNKLIIWDCIMEQLFIIESGIKRKAEKHNCSYCDKEFLRRISKKTKKYCSDDCRKLANKIELICDNCGKKIFKTTSKLKNSKHGFYFCNRECKEKAQSFKGNCPEIRPSHYGHLMVGGIKTVLKNIMKITYAKIVRKIKNIYYNYIIKMVIIKTI